MRKVVVSGRLLIRRKRKKAVELASEDEGPVTSKQTQANEVHVDRPVTKTAESFHVRERD